MFGAATSVFKSDPAWDFAWAIFHLGFRLCFWHWFFLVKEIQYLRRLTRCPTLTQVFAFCEMAKSPAKYDLPPPLDGQTHFFFDDSMRQVHMVNGFVTDLAKKHPRIHDMGWYGVFLQYGVWVCVKNMHVPRKGFNDNDDGPWDFEIPRCSNNPNMFFLGAKFATNPVKNGNSLTTFIQSYPI